MNFKIKIMTEEQAAKCKFNSFDLTWPKESTAFRLSIYSDRWSELLLGDYLPNNSCLIS